MRIFLIGRWLDRCDDRKAKALREQLGRQGRLVSWHCEKPRRFSAQWTARASAAEAHVTVEAQGRSRSKAIRAALVALLHHETKTAR
jgi:hypothetical protein